MKFSEAFGITYTAADAWFDPILTVDTRLFIDPFLIYEREEGVFIGSHAEVIAFFNSVFSMIAQSGGDHDSFHWKRAVDRLNFPEVPEICLGYTGGGTKGSGSGRGFARVIAAGLWDAVQAGVLEIRHFEEIDILSEGIGADRISDLTACLLRHRLAAYTLEVCQRYDVATEERNYLRGRYDLPTGRWASMRTRLPRNPYSGNSVLLVPRQYLRDLPTVNADDFWDYCYSNENELLRREYGQDVTRNVRKGTIVAFARRHAELRQRYLQHLEDTGSNPYDLTRDRKGLVTWYAETKRFSVEHPLSLQIESPGQFRSALQQMIDSFKHFVEQNLGWRLLTNDNGTPRGERAAQDLFLGTVVHYCRANDIDISREPNIGRGPVDFKTSRGMQLRALQEVKLASNTRFWSGIRRQLPAYLKAERIEEGWFIVVIQSEEDMARLSDIQEVISAISHEAGLRLHYVSVDSRCPLSASRL